MLMLPLLLSLLVNHQLLFYLLICQSCLPWCHHHQLIVILFSVPIPVTVTAYYTVPHLAAVAVLAVLLSFHDNSLLL